MVPWETIKVGTGLFELEGAELTTHLHQVLPPRRFLQRSSRTPLFTLPSTPHRRFPPTSGHPNSSSSSLCARDTYRWTVGSSRGFHKRSTFLHSTFLAERTRSSSQVGGNRSR